MNIQQQRAREDYAEILPPSVERLFARHFQRQVEIVPWDSRGAQRWWLHPVLGGYSQIPTTRAVRAFLRDSLRYTPVWWRVVPQWAVVTQLSSRLGVRVAARPGFALRNPVRNARCCLVIPGNQRVRLFDFDSRITTVCVKEGFSHAAMSREIGVRNSDAPAPPLADADATEGWLRERIIDAYALVRCPPWYDREFLARSALASLDTWSDAHRQEVEAPSYVRDLRDRISPLVDDLHGRFGGDVLARANRAVDWLTERAGGLESLVLAPSHGDLQAGNILVEKRSRDVHIIDWEHSGIRSRDYDRVVYWLGVRARRGLAARAQRLMQSPPLGWRLGHLPEERRQRSAVVTIVLLEDLLWCLTEVSTGPFRRLPPGAEQLLEELDCLASTR